jgi:hypothetical protein
MENFENKIIEDYNGLSQFCAMYQEMRNAQNAYFTSKKGQRWPSKESKQLLAISKELEDNLDKCVQDWINEDEKYLEMIIEKNRRLSV